MKAVAAVWLIGLSVGAAGAQTAADVPEFEVASVKAAVAREGGRPLGMNPFPSAIEEIMGFNGGPGTKDPGRIDYQGVSLKMLLVRAYQVRPEQISGPAWLATERYDIVAKVPMGTDADRFRLMLQKLLMERFQITLHRETKEVPVYRLTVAKNGPKLQPPKEAPTYKNDDDRAAGAMQSQLKSRMETMMRAGNFRSGRSFGLSSATMAKFTETLSANLERPVKDMTGIEGLHSFELRWVPDNTGTSTNDDVGPTIFIAIQEQLGLRLDAGKEAIELLMIDKAEKVPVSN